MITLMEEGVPSQIADNGALSPSSRSKLLHFRRQ